MIEKDDVKRIKTIQNYEQFERAVMEAFHAVEAAGDNEVLIPVNQSERGYHMAVVELDEEEMQNLSESWAEEME